MARTKSFDKKVEEGIGKLLDTVLAGDLTEAQSTGAEIRLKVLGTAINYMKVKHKIDEGAAGSAFNDPPEENV